MNCPYCQSEMVRMYAQSDHKIFLVGAPSKMGMPMLKKDRVRLTCLGSDNFEVQVCVKCKKSVFDIVEV